MKAKLGDEFFKVAKYLMILSGSWQITQHWPKRYRVLYKIYYYLASFHGIYGATLFLILRFFVLLFRDKNMTAAMTLLAYCLIAFVTATKMQLCKAKEMTELIVEGIEEGNKSAEKDSKIAEIIKTYSHSCNILNYMLLTLVVLLAIVYNVNCKWIYQQYIKSHSGELPLHLLGQWHPFDPAKHFDLAVNLELSRAWMFTLYNSSSQMLFNTIMTRCAAQLEILKHNFRNFDYGFDHTPSGKTEALMNLKKLVKEHHKMISYVKRLNESTKYLMLLEYNVSSIMMASVLLELIHGENVILNILFIITVNIQMLVLCCNANEIQIQSMGIAVALYESNWYEHGKDVAQIVNMVMIRAQRPLSITVGPFGPVVASMALERLKLAYSYISIISGGNV